MSQKQDTKDRKAAKKAVSPREQKGEESAGLEEALEAEKLSAAQARSLQNRSGNQALIDALGQRSGAKETSSQEEDVEQQAEREKKEEKKTKPRRRRPSAESDGGSGSMAHGESFWEMLFGGEDDGDDPRPPKRNKRLRQRRRPWLPARMDLKQVKTSDSKHHLAPRRPHPQAEGHRFFYALDVWMDESSQWMCADPHPEGLIDLPIWHPLSRAQRAAQFWQQAGTSTETRNLANFVQRDPRQAGHCTRIARAAGLLALTQAAECDVQDAQRVADATAVALQESARWAIEHAARQAEAMLTTDRLFKASVHEENGSIPPVPQVSSTPHADCPLLRKALRFALPNPGIPALIWLPLPPESERSDSAVSQVDAILAGETQSAPMQLRELGVPIESANRLLNACGKMRLDLSAAALALWRTCGHNHYHAMRGLLRAADRRLRHCALGIAVSLDKVEELAGLSRKEALANLGLHRDSLLEFRSTLQNIEEDVHRALVSLCTQQVGPVSPWVPEPGQSATLFQAWEAHEKTEKWTPVSQSKILKEAADQGNPWLCVRAMADLHHRSPERSTNSNTGLPTSLEGLPDTDGLLKSALEEERELSSTQGIN